MSIKNTITRRPDPNRVGNTYGDRVRAEKARANQIESQPVSGGLFRKIKDFFSTDPKVASVHFESNAKFLDGANVHPLQALADIKPRRPSLSDEALFAHIDTILGKKA